MPVEALVEAALFLQLFVKSPEAGLSFFFFRPGIADPGLFGLWALGSSGILIRVGPGICFGIGGLSAYFLAFISFLIVFYIVCKPIGQFLLLLNISTAILSALAVFMRSFWLSDLSNFIELVIFLDTMFSFLDRLLFLWPYSPLSIDCYLASASASTYSFIKQSTSRS